MPDSLDTAQYVRLGLLLREALDGLRVRLNKYLIYCVLIQGDQQSAGSKARRTNADVVASTYRQHRPHLLHFLHHFRHPRRSGSRSLFTISNYCYCCCYYYYYQSLYCVTCCFEQ